MKRIRVSLSAGCYDTPSSGVLVKEMPVLFDNRDFNCMLYDEDLVNMPIVGMLWYSDLCRVPSVVYMEDEVDLTLAGYEEVRDDAAEEAQHEDESRPILRGLRENISYEMEWKQRYEGLVENKFCDGKLAGCFCWQHDEATHEVIGGCLVLKKGDYRRNGAFHNIRVVG